MKAPIAALRGSKAIPRSISSKIPKIIIKDLNPEFAAISDESIPDPPTPAFLTPDPAVSAGDSPQESEVTSLEISSSSDLLGSGKEAEIGSEKAVGKKKDADPVLLRRFWSKERDVEILVPLLLLLSVVNLVLGFAVLLGGGGGGAADLSSHYQRLHPT